METYISRGLRIVQRDINRKNKPSCDKNDESVSIFFFSPSLFDAIASMYRQTARKREESVPTVSVHHIYIHKSTHIDHPYT